jgi:hypothetical protein
MKNWAGLMCLVFIGSMATSHATPLDTPDTVDVDGLPCNSLCRAYLAWSHSLSSWFGQAGPEQTVPEQAAPEQATTRPPELVRAKQAAPTNATPFATAKAAKSRAVDAIPPTPEAAVPRAPAIRAAGSKPAADASKAKQAVPAATKPAQMADLEPASHAAAAPDAALSDLHDSVPDASAAAPEQSMTTPGQSTTQTGDSKQRASAAAKDDVTLVALVMARPEITSPTDLAQRSVAIDEGAPASNESVRTAIAAAGAKEVQLSTTETSALVRVIRGEVPAAILALVSPEAAKEFPEIEGFQVFRIPLLPAAPRAPL